MTKAAIKALNDSGRQRLRSYSIAKAQCWLDVSLHEYTRNGRRAFAFEQSRRITQYLERAAGMVDPGAEFRAANPALATPPVNDAQHLRADLWDAAGALKKHSGCACAQVQTACAEVELGMPATRSSSRAAGTPSPTCRWPST